MRRVEVVGAQDDPDDSEELLDEELLDEELLVLLELDERDLALAPERGRPFVGLCDRRFRFFPSLLLYSTLMNKVST